MLLSDYDLAKQIMEERVRDSLRETERRRLLREAGLDQSGWVSSQAGQLLPRLGHLLVALGQRLEHLEAPPAAPSAKPQPTAIISPSDCGC